MSFLSNGRKIVGRNITESNISAACTQVHRLIYHRADSAVHLLAPTDAAWPNTFKLFCLFIKILPFLNENQSWLPV